MMNIKGIFAVSLIAMVAMVAGAHTSNAVAAIASQGYVDQQVGSKLSSISGSTTGSGNVVTVVSASGSTVSVTKGITAEETKNKVTSANYDANVSDDTKYPTVKAVADAIDDVEKKIPAAIKVDSALSSTSTNPVQNKVINTALAGKQATLSAAQLNAVNSGITSTKVSTYDGYNEKITAAKNAADDAAAAANGKVTIAQGPGAANKAVITNSSGNVTTGTISSGMIADGTIVDADIAANAKIATSKISGLGTLATKNAVTSAEITDGTITNADIAANAKIAASKISGLAKVATTGLYGDLTGTPTVNNATLTIQKNGSTVDTFTANASANKTINITVPTATSQLTNDSNFITAERLPDVLPVATADTLGGVKSGGDITVDTSGAVTVKSASRADSATTATNAKTATHDAEGNVITDTYAKKSDIPTASDILTTTTVTSSGTGAVLTGVSVEAGKVTLKKGNVQIPSGGQNATNYVSIWVE